MKFGLCPSFISRDNVREGYFGQNLPFQIPVVN